MKKLLSGIIFLCVVVAGLFIALISRSDKPVHARTAIERQYNHITATPADTFQIPGEVHILAAYDGIPYALDQQAGLIYRIDPLQGNAVIIGRTAVHFPEIPASFQVDSSGVYCFAANQRKIFRFPHTGGLPDSLSCAKFPFSRCAYLTDSTVFTHYYDTIIHKAGFMLADYRDGGKPVSQLYTFPHENDGGLASDGQSILAGNQLPVIYYQHHNSEIHIWDSSGLRTFQTIDRTAPENTIIHGGDSWSISSKTRFINLDGSTDGDYLYVLSTAVSGNQPTIVPQVDVYRLADGGYAGSLHLPSVHQSRARLIAAEKGMLYAAYKQHIVAYQLQIHEK